MSRSPRPIGPWSRTLGPVESTAVGFHDRPNDPQDRGLYNAQVWRERFPDFVRFFFSQVLSEPHSTKPTEDATGRAMETDGETLVIAEDSTCRARDRAGLMTRLSRVHCPALVLHGSDDNISLVAGGE